MSKKLKVAVADFSPLIISEGNKFKGFEIDLWEAIAKEIGVDFEYEKYNFKEIIPLLAKKGVDIGLAGITINEAREKIVDFSHPTLNSGLLISVNKNRNKQKLLKSAKNILVEGSKIIKSALIGVSAFAFIFGNLLWFAEKGVGTFSKNYFPGIFESIWLVICSMSTDSFGDYVPHTWIGRVITIFIIVGGVAIFGLLIAQVTAFLAVKKVRGEINSSRDLANKKVATVEGTTSENILKKIGAKITGVSTINEAYKMVKNNEVDAIVFDAPAAVYYEQTDKDNEIEVVGEIFDKQDYGIALQQNSRLREKINRAFLNIKESGQYETFYRKWFGDDLRMEI